MNSVAPVPRVRDQRLGQSWTRRQTVKNTLIRAAVRVALVVVDRVPPRLLKAAGAGLGKLVKRFDVAARTRARARTRAVLPEADSLRAADESFIHAGEHLAVCALLRRRTARAADFVTISAASLETFRRALAPGRGVLVVSAHVGPFEMIPALLVELGFSPAILVRESYDAALDPIVDRHRVARGVEVLHRGKPGAALRMVRLLRAGRPIGVLPDLGGRSLPAVPTDFLGARVLFPLGAAQLALRTGCAMVIGTLARSAGGPLPYELLFDAVTVQGPVGELTRRVAAQLARAVLRAPADWLWMAPAHLAIADDSPESLSCSTIHHSEPGRV